MPVFDVAMGMGGMPMGVVAFGIGKEGGWRKKRGVKRVIKPTAIDVAVAALREELENDEWRERLPGTRVVAKRLGVSPPTVASALLKLAAEGLVERGGERCAYRVVHSRRSAKVTTSPTGQKRLLILTPEEMGRLVDTSRRLIEKLRDRMAAEGWAVSYQVVDFVHVKRPQRSWDRTIQVELGTSVIALYGRPALAEWASRRNLRIFFLGGVSGDFPVSMAGVKSSQIAEAALARLTSLGHWRIVLPLSDRAAPFKEGMRQVMKHAIEGAGRTYVPSYHNPESDVVNPDTTWRIIEAAFVSNPPTALVFLDWIELVTAQSYLLSAGLRIPEDVSVVLLNDQMEAEWFRPKLCRFRFPISHLLKVMVRWLKDGSDESIQRTLPAAYVEGESMAPPPSS